MKILFKNHTILIKLDIEIYNIEMLHKCFYWYTDEFIVEIKQKKNTAEVKLSMKDLLKLNRDSNEYKKLINKIKNDIIDFKSRDIITKETKNIRELLIAKAFYPLDEGVETPPGDISDPVGFNIDD